MATITDLNELETAIRKEVEEKFGNNLTIKCVHCDDTNPNYKGIMVTIIDYTTSNEEKYDEWGDDVDMAIGDDPTGTDYLIVECFMSVQEWFARHEEMMMENYCEECDNVVHSLVNIHDFYSFKAGRIKCDECGHCVSPCNECWDEKNNAHHNCADCPYKNSKVLEPLSDEDFVRWHKKNESTTFECMVNGEFGEYYQSIAEKINEK